MSFSYSQFRKVTELSNFDDFYKSIKSVSSMTIAKSTIAEHVVILKMSERLTTYVSSIDSVNYEQHSFRRNS